jgi:hypothetical protein
MAWRGNGDHLDLKQELGLDVFGAGGLERIDGQVHRSVAQVPLGGAEPGGDEANGQRRKLGLHGAEPRDQHVIGKQRVDRQRQLGLDTLRHRLGFCLERIGVSQQLPGVDQQRRALGRQDWKLSGAIKQGDVQAGLQRPHRLADRGLDPLQLARRRRKAAQFGNGDQHAQLVQGQAIQHDASSRLMG